MKQLVLVIAILISAFSFAQEKDKALQKSNDFVYDGNTLVDKDFIAAEKEYRKAISEKPSNTTGTYNLGNAYYKSGLYSEAIQRHLETANLAITKTEKHQAFHNLGNALMQQKQCKEAVEAFKNALRNDPTDEETRYNLVLAKECAEQQGNGGGGDDNKENQDQKNQDKKEGDDKKDQNKDKGDDKKDNKGDDKEDQDGKPKNEKGDNKDGEPKDQKKQQPQPGKLSPQQVKNLLEAMNNQEKKVQEKINAKKVKGEKVKTEKDW